MLVTNYVNPWLYKGKEFIGDDLKELFGFVYCITSPDGRKYIGRKYFWSFRKKKGKTRKSKAESDWKKYYGSNIFLKEEVKHGNKYDYKREILRLCRTKGETNYHEVKLQFDLEVLHSDDYWNDNINGKWYKKWVRNYKEV